MGVTGDFHDESHFFEIFFAPGHVSMMNQVKRDHLFFNDPTAG
jgi:hypothetical protein